MSARFASPTPSENEVDIVGDLFADDFGGFGSDLDGDNDETSSRKRKKTKTAPPPQEDDLDLGAILEGGGFTDASNGLPKKKGVLTGANLEDGDDEAYIALQQAAAFRKTSNLKGAASVKGGGFQAMGLNPTLLRAITRKGFSVPTPIQRKTIPLILGRRDVVGMARTGSGKTAAFVIPMIQRLRSHSVRVGARALIMSPSRELAMQTLKVVKELGRDTDLKTVLLVGGDSLEEQFALLASNPDIVIATPGRFLHLKVEMSLDLSSIKYVVFDEADRLFEMGFAAQLTEILHALPPSRQTLLFSATLPSSLVEFARAGLQDPSLVRLDIETKISPKLKSAFFSVKGPEKEGALLHVLHDVIKIPLGLPEAALKAREEGRRSGGDGDDDDANPRKRKRLNSGYVSSKVAPTEHSTIVFAATKHHVEYLASILSEAGFAVSYVYGSLDQTARRIQVENFRHGRTNIMVVTDLAARGIDIPVLANVVNYDFPPQAKVFVHRVGRTARADQEGSSYSLVQDTDAPYLVDLQLFLGRKLLVGRDGIEGSQRGQYDLTRDIVVGSLARSSVEPHVEWVTTLLGDVHDVELLRQVASKAQKQYFRTRLSASSQSAKRAREIVRSRGWSQLHPIFGDSTDTGGTDEHGAEGASVGLAREDLLAKITGYKPQESIFEVHHQNKKAMKSKAAEIMRTMRKRAGPRRSASGVPTTTDGGEDDGPSAAEINGADYEEGAAALVNGGGGGGGDDDDDDDEAEDPWEDDDDEDEDYGADVLENADAWAVDNGEGDTDVGGAGAASWVDSSVYMSYTPRAGPSMDARAVEERGYGVHGRGGDDDMDSGFNSFAQAARDATMDLTNDDTAKAFGVPTRTKLRWDKKQGKYVARANDEDGSRVQGGKGGGKMIRGESGVKIAASFQSGRFDKWRKANRLGRLPQVGDAERSGLARQVQNPAAGGSGPGGRGGFNAGPGTGRFMHKKELAPKEADKFRGNYHVQKKRVTEARENRVGRFKDGEGSYREVKGMDDVRKARKVMEQKKLKNARPARDGGRGGGRSGGGGGRGRGGGRGGGGRGGRGGRGGGRGRG
ncbi:ATP-dependent RNA helicase DDX54/DBP10 [Sporothrix brasiliensis 5110]|uniref:RNA helicase n=1 Tax=Sporothrix brasiliensis 5110 TaxID=1398154 RepID=A0A0C2J3Q1_9PEZI|nr:ATP-dependent RNA helicase DDX54/DBP10 [Sporothrix brasiliensis 5110]KIH91687.1 ATP-dependent RNA helicase DDX54/DBP10 [Sporothrix brasiliensis 5110]